MPAAAAALLAALLVAAMWQAYALAFLCLLAFLLVSRRNGASATPVGATLEDALSMLNHPAGVAIPLRYGYGLRAPAAGEYSRWHCVGGLEDVGETEHRTCVFNHVRRRAAAPHPALRRRRASERTHTPRAQVCYDAADADFLFYARVANRLRISRHRAITTWFIGNELNGAWNAYVCEKDYEEKFLHVAGGCTFGDNATMLCKVSD